MGLSRRIQAAIFSSMVGVVRDVSLKQTLVETGWTSVLSRIAAIGAGAAKVRFPPLVSNDMNGPKPPSASNVVAALQLTRSRH